MSCINDSNSYVESRYAGATSQLVKIVFQSILLKHSRWTLRFLINQATPSAAIKSRLSRTPIKVHQQSSRILNYIKGQEFFLSAKIKPLENIVL